MIDVKFPTGEERPKTGSRLNQPSEGWTILDFLWL